MSERVSHEVHAAALGGRLQGARTCGRDPVSITDNRYVEGIIDPRFPGARRTHGEEDNGQVARSAVDKRRYALLGCA